MNALLSPIASLVTFAIASTVVACSGGPDSQERVAGTQLRIAVACSSNADCPQRFECEAEHGATFCVSREQTDGGQTTCPAGYETEEEHGHVFCKPHGSKEQDAASQAAPSPSAAPGACQVDADCGPGRECEMESEHGRQVSFCKDHGRSK